MSRGTATVRLVPYGVVGVVPPWNGSMMGMGQKCGPALAAGNTVVAKPPELAPVRHAPLRRAGPRGRDLPPGVLNVVVGGAAAGAALAGHPGVDKLTFTGGAATARAVMAAAAGQPDARSPSSSAASPRTSCFPTPTSTPPPRWPPWSGTALLSGQGCALPTRTYVHDDVYDEVVDRVLATLATLPVGDPLDPATFVGPVVTEAAMERILGRDRPGPVRRGHAAGRAAERLGGDLADGWFVAPTVFGDVDHDSDLARNEVFGPVQAILRFCTEDEVLAKANDSPVRAGRLRAHRRPRPPRALVSGIESGVMVTNGTATCRRPPRSAASSRADSGARGAGPASRRWSNQDGVDRLVSVAPGALSWSDGSSPGRRRTRSTARSPPPEVGGSHRSNRRHPDADRGGPPAGSVAARMGSAACPVSVFPHLEESVMCTSPRRSTTPCVPCAPWPQRTGR